MRNLVAISFLLISFVAGAQNAKPFKVTIAAGYATPANQTGITKAGFVYSLEPQYQLGGHIDVGLRLEQAFVQRPEFIDPDNSFQTKAKSILSAVATANYVLNTDRKLRPYAGLGAGLYYAAASQQSKPLFGNNVVFPLPATTNFGGLARIGAKYKIFHLEAAYNVVTDTQVTNAATRLTLTAKNSYVSLKIGLTIGGSR